jgi:hypothetical protein
VYPENCLYEPIQHGDYTGRVEQWKIQHLFGFWATKMCWQLKFIVTLRKCMEVPFNVQCWCINLYKLNKNSQAFSLKVFYSSTIELHHFNSIFAVVQVKIHWWCDTEWLSFVPITEATPGGHRFKTNNDRNSEWNNKTLTLWRVVWYKWLSLHRDHVEKWVIKWHCIIHIKNSMNHFKIHGVAMKFSKWF